MTKKRKTGISVLIACQNEEALVALCIRSFLDFGDELIVVDNSSTDKTKTIVRALAAQHPEKIKFFDVPELVDLYHNRQFAFKQSSYEWIVRADSDFVAYTDGDHNIMQVREYLLSRSRRLWPLSISVPLGNVSGDFWHTYPPFVRKHWPTGKKIGYYPAGMSGHRMRIYRYLPFFDFRRLGRWESVRFHRLYRLCSVRWDKPLWMHCDIKSDMNRFFRSERTNWRQSDDFKRYPALQSYIESIVDQKYGTNDLAEGARIYLQKEFLPNLELYDPDKCFRYPSLVRQQMKKNPIYKISSCQGKLTRKFLGIDPVPEP